MAVFLLLSVQTVSAKVSVQTRDCGIVYTLHFAFVGDGASDAFIQRVKDGINNIWNKDFTCGDCQCKAKVEVDAINLRGGTCADAPAGYECVTVIATAGYHRSKATLGRWDENSHETQQGVCEWDTADDENVLAHESGHSLGLEDEYEDNFQYSVKDAAGNVVSGPHYVRRAEYNDAKRAEIERGAPAGSSVEYDRQADGKLRIHARPKAGYAGGNSIMYTTGAGAAAQQRHVTELCRQAKASCGNECCCGNNKFESSKENCDFTASPTGCPHTYTCTQKCACEQPPVVCGDGRVEVQRGEKCDVNATSLSNFGCQEGYYCTENCSCILRQTPICGDKVKEPGEECDWSSASCPTDYRCNSQCKCERVPRCGDGILDPGEQCDGNAAVCDIPNAYCTAACQCARTAVCGDGQVDFPEHCESNSDCPSGSRCTECQCVAIPKHTICDLETKVCREVEGAGANQCSTDADCRPPVVDCSAWCSGQNYGTVLTTEGGGQYSSSEVCKAAAAEEAQTCTTLCIYTKFYTASNQAGTTTCCCKEKRVFQCTNCPAVAPSEPQCPDPETTCAANAP